MDVEVNISQVLTEKAAIGPKVNRKYSDVFDWNY